MDLAVETPARCTVYRRRRPEHTPLLRLTPLELIEPLAALIPPPRLHRHRYHGVLAPNSPQRAQVTAWARPPSPPPPPLFPRSQANPTPGIELGGDV